MRPLLPVRIVRVILRGALLGVLCLQLGVATLAANSLRYETLHLPTFTTMGLCGPYLGGDYNHLIIWLDISTTAKSLTFIGPSLPGDVPVNWSYPVSGDPVLYRSAGKPILWSGDLQACRRMERVAKRVNKHLPRGRRRPR